MIEKITKYVNHWRGGECLCCVKVSSWNHKENDLTVLKLQLSIKSTCYRFQVPFKIKANVSGQDKNYQTLIVPHCNTPSPTSSNLAYSFQLPTSKGMRTHIHKASISPVPHADKASCLRLKGSKIAPIRRPINTQPLHMQNGPGQ